MPRARSSVTRSSWGRWWCARRRRRHCFKVVLLWSSTMKFAEHLSAHITPEWRKQYINYEVSTSFPYALYIYRGAFCNQSSRGLRLGKMFLNRGRVAKGRDFVVQLRLTVNKCEVIALLPIFFVLWWLSAPNLNAKFMWQLVNIEKTCFT